MPRRFRISSKFLASWISVQISAVFFSVSLTLARSAFFFAVIFFSHDLVSLSLGAGKRKGQRKPWWAHVKQTSWYMIPTEQGRTAFLVVGIFWNCRVRGAAANRQRFFRENAPGQWKPRTLLLLLLLLPACLWTHAQLFASLGTNRCCCFTFFSFPCPDKYISRQR